MPDWEKIFKDKGYVFVDPHSDIPRLASLFQQEGIHRILDLGCGTGRHLVYLSKAGFEMFGLDSSQTALDLVVRWLKEEGLKAKYCNSRMEEPFPYAADFFDAVISIQAIHHNLVSDIQKTLREIERVLKAKGYLFITVPVLGSPPEDPADDWELHEVEKGTFIPHRGPESGIPHHYFTEKELHEVLDKFDILEMYIDDTNHRCVLARRTP